MNDRPLRIVLVTPQDFAFPSEMQVLGFANELTRQGHTVMMSMGGDPDSHRVERLSVERDVVLFGHRFRGPHLDTAALIKATQFRPDVVHAWDPRVPTASAARDYARATSAPYLVHFEDDDFLPWPEASRGGSPNLSATVVSQARRVSQRVRRRAWWLHPPIWSKASPLVLRRIRCEAAALDALTPALSREVCERLGRTCAVLLPVLPDPAMTSGRSLLVRGGDERVVLFAGRIVPSSLPDIALAMEAVALLRYRGLRVRLVQTGAMLERVETESIASRVGLGPDGFTQLGHVPYADVFPTMQAADVLIQPGPPSRFNTLRLPSKLQAYLASGTPTVSFAVGVGELLVNGDEALLTYTDSAEELADRVADVLVNEQLSERLGRGGMVAAARLFDRSRNTTKLVEHYRRAIQHQRSDWERTDTAETRQLEVL